MGFSSRGQPRAGSERGSRPRLSGPADLPFVGREPFERDRPAGVEPPGGDADLGAEAEFAAVGELGAGVDHHDRAVDFGQEAFGGGLRRR